MRSSLSWCPIRPYTGKGITGDAAAELSKATTSLAYDFGNAFAMDDTEALGVVQDYISREQCRHSGRSTASNIVKWP